MPKPLHARRSIAVVGAGRIGRIHARHARELAAEDPSCDFAALVDQDMARAREVAASLPGGASNIQIFSSVEDLLATKIVDTAVVCTPTEHHYKHSSALLEAGCRVLVEKPLTPSLKEDRAFARLVTEKYPKSLMLAFQRRFDEPLCYAREQLRQGAIGTPFKVVSALEDSQPPPVGYQSPGLLFDMAVHNVDEILWLTGERPVAAATMGSRVFSHKHSPVEEDYDDALLQMWFDSGMTAQVQVGRNHVAGYRVETWIYGDKGTMHVGRFNGRANEVRFEMFFPSREPFQKIFPMRDYGTGLPEFAGRFGLAYKAELAHFLDCCQNDKPFGVDQNDGVRAMEVIAAGMSRPTAKQTASAIEQTAGADSSVPLGNPTAR